MTSMNTVLENRPLIRSRIGPPDVYPQDPRQKEDELSTANVKQGFNNQIPYIGETVEHGTAQHFSIDANKLNKSFNGILMQKQTNFTYADTVKKKPALTKDNFWLVPVAKNRNHQQWIRELKAGAKTLSSLGRRVPIFSKKEEVFQIVAENQLTIFRATWYIKMTAQHILLQAEAKNKKNRITLDHNPDWTASICRFMRDQLSRLLDDQTLNNSTASVIPPGTSIEDLEKQFDYISKLANHMYSEGMLDRHEFLNWIVETMEKIRLHGTRALGYMMPLVMKHIQDILKNQFCSRRLAFVTTRLLSWLLNEATWGNSAPKSSAIESPSPMSVGPPSVSGQPTPKQHSAPPTPSQVSKPLSPQKLGQTNSIVSVKPRTLPANFPRSLEDIVYGLICIVQAVTMECVGALVWYPPDDPRTPGSPLDYLPVPPSLLPLPTNKESSSASNDSLMRARLREVEADIVQRSFAAELRWSSDKCQESVTGQTISRILATLELLDKQQNFDRTESIDLIYSKIFAHSNNKDGNDQGSQASEEAVIWLLCEWAVSAQRLGEHRPSVVAKLLDKRQMLLEQEQVTMATERAKALNSSNLTMSGSNPGSVGTALSSPPPQLLVEGVEPPQMDTLLPQQSLPVRGLMTNNPHMFQNLLFNFLDTQAPILDNPSDKNELQSFKNLVMLFSELIQHDVFSHDDYVNSLISTGDITPGQISPLPIYSPNFGPSTSLTWPLGYSNHSVGVVSVPSEGPTSVGGPVSNKAMEVLMKPDVDDDLPSARSLDAKNDSDRSPTVLNSEYPFSPFGRSMNERHFMDVIKKIPDNPKEKNGTLALGTPVRKPNGPIWGYKQPRHVQILMHLPIPFEDDDCIHESNQRMMVLYGAGRQRNEVKREVKKITKHVCKLIHKQSSVSPKENNFCHLAMKSTSGVGSKKSKNRINDFSHPPTQNVLMKRFCCLTYFDKHYVTAQAAKAILSTLNDYVSDRSFNLPLLSSITSVLNLMEEGLNVSGMVQLSVQISSLLTSLESKISQKNPERAGCYTKDLALNAVAILRHYQSYLTLDTDLTRQAFDAMYAFIKQSNIASPDQCSSADRCILIFLYDLSVHATSPRSKYLLDNNQVLNFSSYALAIKRDLCQSKFPATSNCRYENSSLREYIENPNSTHPLLIAQEKYSMLHDATIKYSFVCTAIITMCSGHHTPESLTSIATLCAEMNARCNDLSSEWLGVLKALCCSSSSAANFTDVLLYVDASNEAIRDPLALFTSILIARNCLSMENFIKDVAIPPLLAACETDADPGNPEDPGTGARLTCHILLQLFKTPVPPDPSKSEQSSFYIPEAADRHLLAASQRNICVGAVLAVLKAIVKLGDASFSGRHSSSPSNNDAGMTSFLAPLGHDEMDDSFALPGQTRPPMNSNGSKKNQSLSEFAKNAVRVICSQQWVRERCLKNIKWDFLMDKKLTQGQRQNLIQLICCPEEDLQISDMPHGQYSYVLQVLHRMSRWTLRQTFLELQIMLKQSAQDERLSDDIAKAVIEVFKNQNLDPTKHQKSLVTGIELDKSNVWLMPPLISELSSQVQAKVLHEASAILETSQHWSRSKSDRDRNLGKNQASLLSQQPFLALILTCLKGQDEQRETLLESLQSQILMFHTEWQSSRQQQRRDGSMSQTIIQEALQLRLSLMGGMFDTVQSSSPWTSSVVVLLTQLISSGMVDIEVNAKLFNTVFDMIAVLLHGTLGGDAPNGGEGSKRDYHMIVKKIRKEISDGKSTSLKILRRLLPVPRKEVYVVTCEPSTSGTERRIASKQKIVNWDIIEALKTSAPLCLPWYGASKTERKELPYESQQRLMLFHDHKDWQQPIADYLKPPELPVEEEEKPPTPKPQKRKATPSSSKLKSPSGSQQFGVHKDSLLLPNKKMKQEKPKKKPKKSQDLAGSYTTRHMGPNMYNSNLRPNNIAIGSMGLHPSQSMRPPLSSYASSPAQSYMYPPQATHHANMTPSHSYGVNHPNPQIKAHNDVKVDLFKFLQTRSARSGQQYQAQSNPYGMSTHMHTQQPMDSSSRNAIRTMMMQKGVGRGAIMPNDMGQLSYRPRQSMGPPMPTRRSMNSAPQGQMSGYNNYVSSQQSGGSMSQIQIMRNPNYNYQSNMSNQQQGYHQSVPSQSYINQPNSNMGQGYSLNNMQMQSSGMNRSSGYEMSGGMPVQNQSGMMGGQQPPQYGAIGQQQRTINRMAPQRYTNVSGGSQGSIMQMQGMGGGKNAMNPPMARTMQMVNHGMGSQQETAQLVKNLRRNMPNQGGMYS